MTFAIMSEALRLVCYRVYDSFDFRFDVMVSSWWRWLVLIGRVHAIADAVRERLCRHLILCIALSTRGTRRPRPSAGPSPTPPPFSPHVGSPRRGLRDVTFALCLTRSGKRVAPGLQDGGGGQSRRRLANLRVRYVDIGRPATPRGPRCPCQSVTAKTENGCWRGGARTSEWLGACLACRPA